MNIRKNIQFLKEGDVLISTQKIDLPVLGAPIEIWVHTDSVEQIQPTDKQWKVLDRFLNIEGKELEKAVAELENVRESMILKKEIIKSTKPLKDFTHLHYQWLVLPKQEKSTEDFLLIYAETDWRYRYKTYTVEIEVLFTDNKLEVAGESTGLWARVGEWERFL